MYLRYNIHKTDIRYTADAVRELLRQIWEREQPVRLVFFGPASDNIEYDTELEIINSIVNEWYPAGLCPLVTYVAQRPLDCTLAVETQNIGKEFADILTFRELMGARYAVIEGERNEKMLMTAGVRACTANESTKVMSDEVFTTLKAILDAEGMVVKNIDRQWNYIERITRCGDGSQNYQEFNDARSTFYADTTWSSGYPAATGIGTAAGGVIVEIDAAALQNTRTVALDNKFQIAAHEYSKKVLLGDSTLKSTPKFERARAIVSQSIFGDREAQIYISGTAAIRGELSLENVGIEQQTITTIENIEYLISNENLKIHGIFIPNSPTPKIFRIYLKYAEDLNAASEIITRLFPALPCLYVLSDVCRDELLIEIEGLAELGL